MGVALSSSEIEKISRRYLPSFQYLYSTSSTSIDKSSSIDSSDGGGGYNYCVVQAKESMVDLRVSRDEKVSVMIIQFGKEPLKPQRDDSEDDSKKEMEDNETQTNEKGEWVMNDLDTVMRLKKSVFHTLGFLYSSSTKKESVKIYSQSTSKKLGGSHDALTVKIAESAKKSYKTVLVRKGYKRKHANIPQLFAVYDTGKQVLLLTEHHHLSLRDLLIDNISVLETDEIRRRFLFFQIYQLVLFMHGVGFSLGDINPSSLMVNDMLWVSARGFRRLYDPENTSGLLKIKKKSFGKGKGKGDMSAINAKPTIYKKMDLVRAIGDPAFSWDVAEAKFNSKNLFDLGEKVIVARSAGGFTYGRVIKELAEYVYRVEVSAGSVFHNADMYPDKNLKMYGWKDLHSMSIGKLVLFNSLRQATSAFDDLQSKVLQWQHGEMSNLDYLMLLNRMAGRKTGDFKKNPVVPWVTDFDGNWRDLTKSKFRMKKGDRMLDFTFDSPNPHHLTEPLSEISYFTYLARRVPVKVLKKYVRARFEPKEYPNSMKRIYEWTPEECIPEFYTDSTVFKSLHPEMGDLVIPEWAKDARDFIKKHRDHLESDHVSRNLHHWIDLIFGFKLSGQAAIDAKNVIYRKQTNDVVPSPSEYVQLFKTPHPKRLCAFYPELYRGKRKDKLINLEKYGNFYLDAIQTFEQTVSFSSLYFQKPQYHLLPLLQSKKLKKRNDKNEFMVFTREELYADDQFALGCLLYEIYAHEPLFTTRTLDLYLQGKYVPQMNNMPMPIQKMVKKFIDLNAYNRKKVFVDVHLYREIYPNYFFKCHALLRKFYDLEDVDEQYEFVIKHEYKITKTLPRDGFFLVLAHVVNEFFRSPKSYNKLVNLLTTRRLIREKIQHYKGCNKTLRYLITSKLHNLFDPRESVVSQDLTLNVLSYSFVNFLMVDLCLPQKEFLETILPFYVECLYENVERKKIAHQAYLTVSKVSIELGIVISLRHIVEPVIARLCRMQFVSDEAEMIFMLLLKLAMGHQTETIFVYYFHRFLDIFLKEYLEYKSVTNENIIYYMFGLLEKILIKLNITLTRKMIDNTLKNNAPIIGKVFENYNNQFCSLQLFQKIVQIICYLMHVSTRFIREHVLKELQPILSRIFNANFSLEQLTMQRPVEAPTFNHSQTLDSRKTVESKRRARNKSVLNEKVSPSKRKKASHSSLFDFLKLPRVGGHKRTVTEVNNSGVSNVLTNKPGNRHSTAIPIPTNEGVSKSLVMKEIQMNTPPKVRGQKTRQLFSKRDFEISCMVYREMCCVVGNTAMREAIPNSDEFEAEIHRNFAEGNKNKRDIIAEMIKKFPDDAYKNSSDQKGVPSTSDGEKDGKSGKKPRNQWTRNVDEMENLIKASIINSKKPALWWMTDKPNFPLLKICTSPQYDNNFKIVKEHTFVTRDFDASPSFSPQTPGSPHSMNRTRFGINGVDVLKKDERTFLTYGRDGIRCWNLEAGRPLLKYDRHRDAVKKAQFFERNGNICCSLGRTGIVHLWDVPKVKQIGELRPNIETMQIGSFCKPPQGSNLLATIIPEEACVKFFDIRANFRACQEWQVMSLASMEKPILRTISCFDDKVYVGLSNGNIMIFELETGFLLDVIRNAHPKGEVTRITRFGKNMFFSSSAREDIIKLWSTKSFPSKNFNIFQMKNTSSIVDFNVNVDNNTMISIGTSNIIANTKLRTLKGSVRKKLMMKLSGGQRSELHKMDCYRINDSVHEKFTSVRVLPFHRLIMITTDHGYVHMFR